MPSNFVIIVAAGSGSRIGSNLPKQFLLLEDKPILMHTLQKFAESKTNPDIILVLSASMIDLWKGLCQQYNFKQPHNIAIGGDSRFQSVRNGINFIKDVIGLDPNSKIAVHDGARPLIKPDLIDQLYDKCQPNLPAIIPAVQSTNSVRIGNQEENKAIERESVWLVQTPQVFMSDLLIKAYKQPEEVYFTDDASVVEKLSNNLYLFPGDQHNLKITYEEDIAIAQQLCNKSKRFL